MTFKQALLCSTLIALAAPAVSEETRALGAHEHGHGGLNIAVDGDVLVIELIAPGFDIVGFEYTAKSDEDKAAIEAGLAKLSDPLTLFGMPDGANCTVTSAEADLHSEDEHHDDDHDDHGDNDHGEHADDHADHDDHEKDHDEHDDHAAEGHEDHDDHDHDDHGEENHSEFHADYQFTCANPAELTSIELTYFVQFPNAKELDVQLVTDAGASKVEATAAAPVVTLN
ncbi:zinc uptake protein ZrgA [Shimia sagamensis]|uniref:DUF2796 domain-containing protein n=1 Tax=Shimia sagamensis TaxID=1566352 RepID=A0ABY1N5V6_9RHOB|nr:DUF2796 domain-containing protein [Shimia sagamensis]SMP00517.1 Protein of unknown function [Shimia sagamensis]